MSRRQPTEPVTGVSGDPPSPVYVSVETGNECIIYKESNMVHGRPYVVEWLGRPVASCAPKMASTYWSRIRAACERRVPDDRS